MLEQTKLCFGAHFIISGAESIDVLVYIFLSGAHATIYLMLF